ncbi:MAG: M14 family metallopeptidase [Flavobacteriaceae bacterium]|nr:M14 family metallopeptidase [Flavobacteriaceae bacterium]
MKPYCLFLFFLITAFHLKAQQPDLQTTFEKSKGTETATYEQIIAFYKKLAATYPEIEMQTMGPTDSGEPLHIVTLNPDREFNFDTLRKKKRILLINNGIHPGESDGIDATMMLFRDITQGKLPMPENTVLVTIPVYNIGGALNRNSTTRTNQNGPVAYGFRGNARNFDLNRDFVKCDTKNARSFAGVFHLVQPDVFIDNHVSNGADYQYALTHLFTQHDKLGGELGAYLNDELRPQLEQELTAKNWPITPYVNVFNQVPEVGFSQFLDYPRYSTGYTTLFNTLGMMVETHMLKPYKQRVEGTYALMKSMIGLIDKDAGKIKELREESLRKYKTGNTYPLDWEIDSSKISTLHFKGYEGSFIDSKITGAKRLKYREDKPFTKDIVYYDHFKPSVEVAIPNAYVIPKGWWPVIELLQINKVEMKRFEKDTTLNVESYRINSYETLKMPYEGHYPHYNTTVIAGNNRVDFRKGDYIIFTDQPAIRYLMETLEPQGPDSFFNWNFFDAVLQQKEHFSPYVWEDMAEKMLKENPALQAEFEHKKQTEPDFAKNWYAQLDWLHKHSDHYEKAHLQYPVYRIIE